MKHIFFIGIGGKGLNGLAKMCLEQGITVSGVDTDQKPEIISLIENGAKIFNKHSANNIDGSIDLVVYSSLIQSTCPEIISAKKLGIKIMKRAQFLGQMTQDDFRISICGSHGKSTTTAIVGLSLINANVDASIYGGAHTKEINGYNHKGKSIYSVIESCEYDRSFFNLVGDISIITSIEKGHLEYYANEDEMLASFKHYVDLHDKNAVIIANGDNVNIRRVTANASAKVIYFGFNLQNDFVIGDVYKNNFSSTFSIFRGPHKILNNLTIKIPGDYNILNFTSSAILLNYLGISLDGVIETARHFTGVGRRFEISKTDSGHIFIDDFAHHPTQVKNLFLGIRQFFPGNKTCAVFQPRQFNLMKNFKREYGSAFKLADEVVMTDILPSLGDTAKDIKSISTEQLAHEIRLRSAVPVKIIKTFPEIVNYLKKNFQADSVITTIGAGDIYKLKSEFIKTTHNV